MRKRKKETLEIKDKNLKTLKLGFQYQRAFEEAFKKYSLTPIYKELKKHYGIDNDGEEATKKKI